MTMTPALRALAQVELRAQAQAHRAAHTHGPDSPQARAARRAWDLATLDTARACREALRGPITQAEWMALMEEL
jgi:hypothetical protein